MPFGSRFITAGDTVDHSFIELFSYDLHSQRHDLVIKTRRYSECGIAGYIKRSSSLAGIFLSNFFRVINSDGGIHARDGNDAVKGRNRLVETCC